MSERRCDERRSGGVSLCWPERRTGFDRRRSYPVSGALRSDERWFALVLVLVFALGLADWALTSRALASLNAHEGNPFMRAAFEAGPAQALLLKLASLGVVIAVMWWLRRYRSIILLAAVTAAFHIALITYHLAGATFLS